MSHDLNLESGYHRASLTDLYLYANFTETFCGRTDVHTYVQMDGYLRSALLGQRVDLKGQSAKTHAGNVFVTGELDIWTQKSVSKSHHFYVKFGNPSCATFCRKTDRQMEVKTLARNCCRCG